MSEIRQAIGWILDVAQVPIGSQLIGDYAAGVTVLTVSDAEPFAEQGGSVSIAGSVLAYTSADSDTDTITLAAPIGFATLDGDDVRLYDDIRAGIAAEFVVTVEFQNDLDGDDDSAPATLAHGLGDRIPAGVRNGRGETVVLQRNTTGSTWTVVDVIGTELSLNGTYITPGTVPPSPTSSDGLVPASSPTPTVGVGIGLAVVSWTATPNADLVTYDVYMNATAPVPEDTAHRVATTTSTVASIDRAKGTWHVIVHSRDADGPAALAGNDVQFVINQDAASLQADLDAAAAKVAAKPRIVFATTQPVPVGTEKIIWYNTAAGYAASYFDGTVWAPYSLGSGALGAAAIQAVNVGFTIGGGNQVSTSRPYDTTVADWSQSNSTISSSTLVGRSTGARAYRVVSTSATLVAYLYRENTAAKAVLIAPSKVYTLSAWVYNDQTTARTISLEQRIHKSDNTSSYPTVAVVVPSRVWTRIVLTNTSPLLADKMGIAVYITPTAVGEVFYATDFQVEEGDVATAYAPRPDEILPGAVGATEIADLAIIASKVSFDIGGNNLLIDSSFESSIPANWIFTFGGRAAATINTAEFFRGTRSIQIQPATNSDSTTAVFPYFAVKNGDVLTVSLHYKVLSGTQNPASGPYIFAATADYIIGSRAAFVESGTIVPKAISGGWYRSTRTFTFSSDGNFRPVFGATGGTPANDTTWVIDAAQIERGDLATGYAPKPDEILPGSITAVEIGTDAVTAPKIIAGAIVAGKIAANAITANEIAANSIVATKIAAGAVTAEKLTIGSLGASAILNGSFEEAAAADATLPAKWTRNLVWGGGTMALSTSSPLSGTQSLVLTNPDNVNSASAFSDSFPVVPGQVWVAKFRAKSSVAAGGLYVRLRGGTTATDYTTNEVISDLENASVPTTATEFSVNFTIPTGMVWARLVILNHGPSAVTAHTVTVDDVSVQQVIISAQIGDGAITTNKIIAGAIVANRIAANTITANQIAAGTITATNIQAGTITAGLIAADSIVSASIVAGTIQATDIAAGTITANEIAVGTITAANILAGTITAQQIAALTITANKIAATTITASQIAAGTITASQIAAATITGTQIAAGSISTTQLTVASLGLDLVRNGRFLDAGAAGNVAALWSDQSAGGGSFYREPNAAAPGGVWQVLYNPGGTAYSRGMSAAFPVAPGDVLAVSCAAAATSATCPFYFRIGWFATDPGTYVSEGDTTQDVVANKTDLPTTYTAPETWARVSGQVTVPADKRFARITLYNYQSTGGYMVLSDVHVRKVLGAVHIGDGAITAPKIVAGAITAEKLTIASLGAELVRDGGFEENTSWSYGASASRPAAAAHSGSVGLRCSASGGAAALSAIYPVAAGQIYSVGCWALGSGSTFYLRTSWLNSAGTEITITDTPAGVGVPGTWTRYDTQVTAPAGAVKAQTHIYNITGTVDVDDVDVKQVIVAAHIADGAITAAKITATAIDGKTITGGIISNANVYMNADFLRVGVAYSGSPYGEVKIDANGYYTGSSYDPVIKMSTPGAKGVVQVGQIVFLYGSGFKTDRNWNFDAYTFHAGAASVAPAGLFNAMLNSSNQLYKSNVANSSKRYKNKVKSLKVDVDALLRLEPRVFHWNKKLLAEGVTETLDLGVIAEEVDALGLTEWVLYDEEGRPDGFRYDKWPMALQLIVRAQADRLSVLEAKLDALLAAA